MNAVTRLRVSELNQHLLCVLCGGYLIDATTVIECLHSFCRTCIVRYLESSKYCPICEVQVHKTRPLDNIRSDKSLQDLVYKLIPNVFENEMKRRREFYKEHPEACSGRSLEERGEAVMEKDPEAEQEDQISLCLELLSTGVPLEEGDSRKRTASQVGDKRYLLCPGTFTVNQLAKFVRMKFSLPESHQVEVYHADCAWALPPCFSLTDIATLYAWQRLAPLQLYYTVVQHPKKKRRTEPVPATLSVAPKDTEPSQTPIKIPAGRPTPPPSPKENGVAEIKHEKKDISDDDSQSYLVKTKAEKVQEKETKTDKVQEKENGVGDMKQEKKDKASSKKGDSVPVKSAAMKSVPLTNAKVSKPLKNGTVPKDSTKGGTKVKVNGITATPKAVQPKTKKEGGGGGAAKTVKANGAAPKKVSASGKSNGNEQAKKCKVKIGKVNNSRVGNNGVAKRPLH